MGDTERFSCLGGPHRVLLGFRGVVCWQYVWSSLLDRACKASYWQPQWGDKYYSYKLSRWDVGACWFPRDVEDEQWTLMGCPTEDGRPLEVACVPLADPPGLMLLLEATLSSNAPSSILIPPFPLIPGHLFYTRVEKNFHFIQHILPQTIATCQWDHTFPEAGNWLFCIIPPKEMTTEGLSDEWRGKP